MKAIIINKCFTQLGDIYSEVYSSYKTFKFLEQLGYEVSINWEKRNPLYSDDLPLSLIIDQSYCNNFTYNRLHEIEKNFIHIPQKYNLSFLIYVSEVHKDLKNYESLIYNCHEMDTRQDLFPLDEIPSSRQFLSSPVLDIGRKFLSSLKNNFKAINFRVNDEIVNFEVNELERKYPSLFQRLYSFLESNENVLMCSNNKNIVKHITNNYPHTFVNQFTHEDISHTLSYNNSTSPHSEEDYVLHAQEIAGEMYCFSQSKEILRLCTLGRHSNFLSYGLAHNIHYSTWRERLSNLFV
jgi:molybdopterin converting factor small subunit